jgi:hypothetical protein
VTLAEAIAAVRQQLGASLDMAMSYQFAFD